MDNWSNTNFKILYNEIKQVIQNGDVERMKEIYGLNLGVFYSRINDLVNYWKEGDIENNKIAKEMFDVMLKAGIGINDGMFINNNSDALISAIETRKPTLVKFFLEEGANPNSWYNEIFPAVFDEPDKKCTALHVAVRNRDLVSYKNLLLAGADPNIRDDFGHVADDYLRGLPELPDFEKIKKELNTLKVAAILQETIPEYHQLDVDTMKEFNDYSADAGKKRRKTIKRRKSIKRRKTIRRKTK
jgi:ankyrin repeat protein